MNGKEVAKFFAGFAANQFLTHGALALAGLQFTLLGITYNPIVNTIATVVWAIIFLALAYYGWTRKR